MLWMAICDDEPSMLGHVEKEMRALKEKHRLDLRIEVFRAGEEILKCMETGHRYDIIFMDIEMEGLNGIETAVQIRKMDLSTHLPGRKRGKRVLVPGTGLPGDPGRHGAGAQAAEREWGAARGK